MQKVSALAYMKLDWAGPLSSNALHGRPSHVATKNGPENFRTSHFLGQCAFRLGAGYLCDAKRVVA